MEAQESQSHLHYDSKEITKQNNPILVLSQESKDN